MDWLDQLIRKEGNMALAFKASDLPTRGGFQRSSKYRELIDSFLASGLEAAEVDGFEGKPTAAATSLRNAAKGKPVAVRERAGKVFMVLVAEEE
jgi:hypothetical protein